jgi:hypothetical protein
MIIKIQNLNVQAKSIKGKLFIPESEAFRIQNSKRKGRQLDMDKICNIAEKAFIGGVLHHALVMRQDRRERLTNCSSILSQIEVVK